MPFSGHSGLVLVLQQHTSSLGVGAGEVPMSLTGEDA